MAPWAGAVAAITGTAACALTSALASTHVPLTLHASRPSVHAAQVRVAVPRGMSRNGVFNRLRPLLALFGTSGLCA